ncbi:unnamed protein product, partial [Amoebophrya sp. A120]
SAQSQREGSSDEAGCSFGEGRRHTDYYLQRMLLTLCHDRPCAVYLSKVLTLDFV